MKTVLIGVAALFCAVSTASADVQVSMQNGRVSLVAKDATVRQILIRSLVSAVSLGTERATLLRAPNTSPRFPVYPGYSLAGEILEVDSSSGVRSTWAYAYLWSRAGTIYSGSSEIQKNVIGERVLGLPKEVRADRLKA